MNIIKCAKCGETKEHQAKGLCFNCYRKFIWKPKLVSCKRCGLQKPNHARGFCASCYNFLFHLDKVKEYNQRKNNGLDMNTYKRIVQKCVICGFDKVVDLHHLDESKKNTSETNLIGLCPNHHRMLHDFRYKESITNELKAKGYILPKDPRLDFTHKPQF